MCQTNLSMKTIRLISIICAALLAITACKKKASDNPSPMENTGSTGTTGPTGNTGATGSTGTTGVVKVEKTKVDAGVYLVGYKSMVENPIDPRATIWKDNNPTLLSTFQSVANAMCVQDTDIYVAGYESPTPFASNAVYWVNKQIVRLTFNSNSGSASAVGIGIVGNDVYVTGNLGGLAPLAVYWKNGDMALLPGTSPRVTGMVVKGNDVYICGSAGGAACYWKNAVLYRTDDNVLGSRATAITVDDNAMFTCPGLPSAPVRHVR